MERLKTVEEVQQSIKNLLYKAHEKNWKNGGVSIYDLADLQKASDRVIIQDRHDIIALLKQMQNEIPTKFEQPFELTESVGKRIVLDDILTLLQKTLGESK